MDWWLMEIQSKIVIKGKGRRMKEAYSIPRINTTLIRMFQQRQRLVFIQDPWLPFIGSIGHGTENDFGDLEAAFT